MTSMEVRNEQEEVEPVDHIPVSQLLIEARERKGLSQQEVAEQLYLTTTFIRYIDEGEFSKFPKPAFVKGYLRTYARVVSLSGDDVVAAYERQQGIEPPSVQMGSLTEEPVGQGNFSGPVLQTGVIGLIAIVIVAALVWWFASNGDEPEPIVTQPGISSRADPAAERDMGSGIEAPEPKRAGVKVDPVDLEPVIAAPELAAAAVKPAVAGGRDAVSSSPEAVTTRKEIGYDRVRDGETSYITIRAGGDTEMEFVFKGECWVEIEDGAGDKIYGDLNRAGDVMTVYGVAPFVVLFGRVPAVTMTYQGKPVDLAQFATREQTAKVRTSRL